MPAHEIQGVSKGSLAPSGFSFAVYSLRLRPMRLPKRLSQTLRDQDTSDDVIYLTPKGKQKLEQELVRIEQVELPPTLESMKFALSLGDYSENAEYQDAKWKLARLHGRILTIKDRLKRAIIIAGDDDDRITLGSTVVVAVNGNERRYTIVGPQEANPSKGRISHLSPVGSALLGKRVGDQIEVPREDDAPLVYRVLKLESSLHDEKNLPL